MADDQLSGREPELEVAKRLFGFRWFHCDVANGVERNQFCSAAQAETWRALNWTLTGIDGPRADQFNDDTAAPRFSESIEAAMQVVEKMWQTGWQMECANAHKLNTPVTENVCWWYVRFINNENDMNNWSAEAETLPEAICRAALAAIDRK